MTAMGRSGTVAVLPVAALRCGMNYCLVKTESVISRLAEICHLSPCVCSRYSAPNVSTPGVDRANLGCVALDIDQKWDKTNGLQRENSLAIRKIFKW